LVAYVVSSNYSSSTYVLISHVYLGMVRENLIGSGVVDQGAIVGLDGSLWGKSDWHVGH
jgi:hypothetical protein